MLEDVLNISMLFEFLVDGLLFGIVVENDGDIVVLFFEELIFDVFEVVFVFDLFE